MKTLFEESFKYKVIYIMSINDSEHAGLLKIGDATVKTDIPVDRLTPNCHELNVAAKKRIDSYTKTAAISYHLVHTELAIKTVKNKKGNQEVKAFRDYDVRDVLKNSGFKRKKFAEAKGIEWFEIDIETAKKAIQAVKKSRYNLSNSDKRDGHSPIIFRPEQETAITRTLKQFKDNNNMLWNAKMRFGKTVCALEVIKRSKYKKTIILTHRPVVDDGWYDDFHNIFYGDDSYEYGSKARGVSLDNLLKTGKNVIYFASIQDLRGSSLVGGKYDKNDIVFKTLWDCVVVDEAHEGTTTALGEDVIKNIVKESSGYNTKFLALSGTPFNIIDTYDDESTYTWDYVMEQQSKKDWDSRHFGDSNPYEDLPEMRIFTYNLGKIISKKEYIELEDKAFNFREFFRTWTGDIAYDYKNIPAGSKVGDFCHQKDILSFLNLITREDENSYYPYSNSKYREYFKHTLWMVPGIKEALALSKMLKSHPVFGSGAFEIVNVAGNGDQDEESSDALQKVRNAIKLAGNDGYTITLSCGKLTTGVTVPEWTAVFMLAGSYSTSASSYLQTIFRVQSPGNINGKMKDCCYVFDFAPDRTLKMVAEAVAMSTKAGKASESEKHAMGEFLNFCPIISVNGTRMETYDTNRLLQQLKRAYAERAVRNGFDDINLYSDELLKLDRLALTDFEKLKKIVGTSKAAPKTNDIDINDQGFTDEQYEERKRISQKPKHLRTPEEEAKLKEINEKKKQKNVAISILRGISIRMPLLIYGVDIDFDKDVTMENLITLVDNASWNEFMPLGVTKALFKKFIKYYDKEIFIAAGLRIRSTVKSADALPPSARIQKITALFSGFKNPDKETVLTPWRVVNKHMGDCIGGYVFFNQDWDELVDAPRYVNLGTVTETTLNNVNSKILEINSKTGLYPLYIAYSIFKKRCSIYSSNELTIELQNKLWDETIRENIYIICKTPMAKAITKRTLTGYRSAKINAHYFDNLINTLSNKPTQFLKRITKASYWNMEVNNSMKFDAVVGNPPYQENISGTSENSSLSKQLFPMFVENAIMLNSKYVSLITPSRWFTADAQDKSFIKLREFLKDHNHFTKIFNYPDNKLLFNNVLIAGGVNYFLFDKDYVGDVEFTECSINGQNKTKRPLFEKGLDIVLSMNCLVSVLDKVKGIGMNSFIPLTTITFGRNAFGIIGKASVIEKITSAQKFNGSIDVRCAYEQIRYTDKVNITKNVDLVDKWKVFTSKGNGGAGILTDEKAVAILGKSYLGGPGSACSDSLIPIGGFKTKDEAVNLQKYMSSKFLRFMVGILKVSQNVAQNVYQFVPMQDFTNKSDIDWNVSIAEIDKQLYQKYHLSQDEVAFIETKIKYLAP
jgi:superfamily II DNA or RNA helicase